MNVGDYMEAHSGSRAWRGIVADYDAEEGFVTLEFLEQWSEPNGAWINSQYPLTLIESAWEWVPARFQPRPEGGFY